MVFATIGNVAQTWRAKIDGTPTDPGFAFASATSSGLYHVGSGTLGLSANGTSRLVLGNTTANITGTLTATSGYLGNLHASDIVSGTLDNARLPLTFGTGSTVYVGNGSLLTGLTTPMTLSNVQITDSSFVVIDDTALGVDGGYLVVNGSGFQSPMVAFVGETPATATTVVSQSQLRVQLPAIAAGSYDLTVIRYDSIAATIPSAVSVSPFPVWSTATALPSVYKYVQFTQTLAASEATSSALVYAATSSLPPGTTLASNGQFTGNIVTDVGNTTTYSFTVEATDTQLQNVPRTFSLLALAAVRQVSGLAGKFFAGDWRSTISTGNIGTIPLTQAVSFGSSGAIVYSSISYTSIGDYYGFIAIGYFTPPTTGTYTFYTSSDDGSGVWIGSIASAASGRTTTNAVLNNNLGGGQGDTKRSGSTTLVGGVTYPIRIVHEEGGGGDNLTFSWSGPGISETTSLATYFTCTDVYDGAYDYLSTNSYDVIATPIVTTGLMVSYDAALTQSYPGSGTTWTDVSGNGITGTLVNGVGYTIADGGSLVLDGVDDTVHFTYDLRSTWTYECWVMHTTVSGFGFLGQGPTDTNSGLHLVFYNATSLRFGMFNNDTDALSLTTSTGVWYQYVFTYNHSSPYTKQIYRNGVQLTGTNVNTPAQYIGTGTVRIGATYSSGGNYANGRFSIARLYNRVLTPEEIQQNFNAVRGRYGV
jgi:hypothetical protein